MAQKKPPPTSNPRRAELHVELLAGEPLLAADEDDVAVRHHAAGGAAVRPRHLVDVEAVGLDARVAEDEVHEPAELGVAVAEALLLPGGDAGEVAGAAV